MLLSSIQHLTSEKSFSSSSKMEAGCTQVKISKGWGKSSEVITATLPNAWENSIRDRKANVPEDLFQEVNWRGTYSLKWNLCLESKRATITANSSKSTSSLANKE